MNKDIEYKIDKKEVEDIYPMSSAQVGILFQSLKETKGNLYTICTSFTVCNRLDMSVFERSWGEVVKHNRVLRTIFRWDKLTHPIQIILKKNPIIIRYIDYSNEVNKEDRFKEFIEQEKARRFDFISVPFNISIVKFEHSRYKIIITHHHILYDGWSNYLLLKSLIDAYKADILGVTLIHIDKDFYKQYLKSNLQKKINKEFWKSYLKDYKTDGLDMNLNIHPEKKSIEFFNFSFSAEYCKSIEKHAILHKVSTVSIIYSAWGLLMQRLNNSSDVLIGITFSGRESQDANYENTIGLFAKTLPLRIRTGKNSTNKGFVEEVYKAIVILNSINNASISDINKLLEIESINQLFDSLVVVENYPIQMDKLQQNGFLDIKKYESNETTHFGLTVSIKIYQNIHFRIAFHQSRFSKEVINSFKSYLKIIINHLISNPDNHPSQFKLIDIKDFNSIIFGEKDFNVNKCHLAELFYNQVLRFPHSIALKIHDETITYKKLNDNSNKLAHLLLRSEGKHNSICCILLERSTELIIALLAVIKSGVGFVTIDPKLPKARINYILKDSNAQFVICDNSSPGIDFDKITINLDQCDLSKESIRNIDYKYGFYDLSYILYTSGTTGRPKGVVIRNNNFVNYLNWAAKAYVVDNSSCFPLFTSISFDLTLTSIFVPLITGNCIRIFPQDKKIRILDIINSDINIIKLTPTHIRLLISELSVKPEGQQYVKSAIKIMIVGGERFDNKLAVSVNNLYNNKITIYNEYGPTETVVGCSIYKYDKKKDKYSSVPIGIPINNTYIYILDSTMNLCPPGFTGQIFIGGDGVSNGYVNKVEQTSSVFIDDPFNKGKTIYKSGDLGFWYYNGNIQYLGRCDLTVKINGYRIDLNEIKHFLNKDALIHDSVVLVKKNENNEDIIVAFIKTRKGINIYKLRETLLENIPPYMIPSEFIVVDEFPIADSGKLDTKALLKIASEELTNIKVDNEYQDDNKRLILKIWREVLGKSQVNTNESFFYNGGDSIKAIQFIARINKVGYDLTLEDLYNYPTINQLGPRLKKGSNISNQELALGQIKFTPIQKWFVEKVTYNIHHFNQAIRISSKDFLEVQECEQILNEIIAHHDALRIKCNIENNVFTQEYSSELIRVEVVEYKDVDEVNELKLINKAHEGLNLSKGKVVKAILFSNQDKSDLVIIIHHFVVDVISWRIIIEDFETLFSQIKRNKAKVLPLKTDSMAVWANKLFEYKNIFDIDKEKEYWRGVNQIASHGLIFDDEKKNYNYLNKSATVELSSKLTQLLIAGVNNTSTTSVEVLLLASLGLTVKEVLNKEYFYINIERHGRNEYLFKGVNIKRTVGWFTTIFPIALNLQEACDVEEAVIQMREHFRQIPNKGMGYGILKYLMNEDLGREPQMSFNYLGQIDTDIKTNHFDIQYDNLGNFYSDKQQRAHFLDFILVVKDSKLNITLIYNKAELKYSAVDNILIVYINNIKKLLANCNASHIGYKTPGDLTYRLSYDELKRLQQKWSIDDVYKTSPMQKGMFVSSMMNLKYSYHVQYRHLYTGKLKIKHLKSALETITARYDILRTIFLQDLNDEILQVVRSEKRIEFNFFDTLSLDYDQEELEQSIERPFNLENDILFRLTVVKLKDEEYEFIWSHHHILLDGWCSIRLLKDYFNVYAKLITGKKITSKPITPYKEYIKWLETKNVFRAYHYWRVYLDGCNRPTRLPEIDNSIASDYNMKNLIFSINNLTTRKIKGLCRELNQTLSTFFQCVWGIMLSKYNDNNDVVFGTVVSGRPAEMKDVEDMVGLFINTLPVRMQLSDNNEFVEVISRLQKENIQSEKYNYIPLSEIQAQSALKNNLINHFLTFINFPDADYVEKILTNGTEANEFPEFKIYNVKTRERSSYDVDVIIYFGDSISIKLRYNSFRYSEMTINGITEHLNEIIDQVLLNKNISIGNIELSHDYLKTETKIINNLDFEF